MDESETFADDGITALLYITFLFFLFLYWLAVASVFCDEQLAASYTPPWSCVSEAFCEDGIVHVLYRIN